ncbi:AAA family ATPase [Pseudomonas sp. 18173]|uniref:AAA family ATPase n=1 Tax=Pseudomonas sp. 18173 TaxID=3390055 RepID=UPI003D1D0C61
MEVLGFQIPGSACKVVIPSAPDLENKVTIILGENGTKKSTLLRALLDDSIQDPEQRRRNRYPSASTIFSSLPSQVIALSAIPNDRFPTKKRHGEDRIDGRYSAENYEYIGPKHNQNIVSRNQSLQALTGSVLLNPNPEESVRRLIERVSKKTGVPTTFDVELSPVMSRFNEHYKPNTRKAGLMDRLTGLEKSMVEDALGYAHSKRPVVRLDLFAGLEVNPELSECLALAYKFGFLNFKSPKDFRESISDHFSIEQFSAGQWGLFSTLATLALRIQDNTLILIDEPESALHPRWQREYIDDLMAAVSHRRGCHIFLATHSPLIVGTVGNSSVELLTLRKDTAGEIYAELSDVPVGWQSNDILEEKFELHSTRSPEFVAQIEEILAIVATGIKGNKTKLKAKLSKLKPIVACLPENDSMHGLISSLIRLAD